MNLNLTGTLGGVLDTFKSLFAKPGTLLKLYHYDAVSGYRLVETVNQSWFAYSESEQDGNVLEVMIFDTGEVDLHAALQQRATTHVLIGSKIYKISGAPNAPIETLDAARYWRITCDPTGENRSPMLMVTQSGAGLLTQADDRLEAL